MSDFFDSDIFLSDCDYYDTYSLQSDDGWSNWSDDYHFDDFDSYLTPDEEYINSFELPSDEECKSPS